MPAQPGWFLRLDQIIEELQTLQTWLLDRQAMEKLFRVGERRARQLMAGLPGHRIGNAFAVERLALIAKCQGLAVADQYTHERDRKQRVADELDKVRKHLSSRRVLLPATRNTQSRRLEGLPDTIGLTRGELRIKFRGAEDLAIQLFELSQAMANDWEAFEEATKG